MEVRKVTSSSASTYQFRGRTGAYPNYHRVRRGALRAGRQSITGLQTSLYNILL